MHDTFLNERIYESLLKLCDENRISRLSKVILTVNTDSHVGENSLREHFSERNSHLLGDWTEITVKRQEIGKLNAVVEHIEGETPNE